MKNVTTYDVFISYSHADKQVASRLEAALRKYRPPYKSGLTPRRLAVFRDESEASGPSLSEGLDRAIAASRKLLVICSPSAFESQWVGQEIELFIKKHGVANVIPVLTAGMPNDEALRLGRIEDCAFPPALIDAMQGVPWSPDFRDLRQQLRSINKVWPAWFHLLAAIYDAPRQVLEQKERIRRIYRTAAGVAILLVSMVTAWGYLDQRNQAISLDLASKADVLRADSDLRRALSLAVQAVEASPTNRARDVLEKLLNNVLRSSKRRPSEIAISPDGAKIAQGSPLGGSVLYDVASQRRSSLCGFVHPVTSLSFSADGNQLVAFSEEDGYLQIFDTTSATSLGTANLDGISSVEFNIALSPDAKSAVITRFSSTPELRRLPSAELVKTLKEGRGHSRVLFNPTNGTFATYPENSVSGKGLVVWDATSGAVVWQGPEDGAFDYVAFPDLGSKIIARTDGEPPEFKSYFIVGELGASRRPERLLKVDPNDMDYGLLTYKGAPTIDPILLRETLGEKVAKSNPELVKQYGRDAPTIDGRRIRVLEFSYVTMSPSGDSAFMEVSSSDIAVVLILSLPDLKPRVIVKGSGKNRPVYSSKGDIVAIALRASGPHSSEDRLVAWSTSNGQELWSKVGKSPDGYQFSQDGSRLVTWKRSEGADAAIWVYDANSGRELAQLSHPDAPMRSSAAWSSELMSVIHIDKGGHTLVSRSEHTAYVWDVDTATRRFELNVFSGDESKRKKDIEALAGAKGADAARRIGRKYLNECPR